MPNARDTHAERAAQALTGALFVSCLLFAGTAYAFKWHECPAPPVPLNPSLLGATQSPFIHPGHELRIVLNAAELASTGGFSLDPEGNSIEITFVSLYGEPVTLAPRTASAVSGGVLSFPFPDSAAEVGRVLAGPVAIRVSRGDRTVAQISPDHLVGLPPANEITGMVIGGDPVEFVQAALSARGDVWIPLHFEGEPGMPMPGCEGNFLLKAPMYVGGAETQRVIKRGVDPLHRVRRVQGYLADTVINGTNFYGLYFPEKIRLLHVAGTRGVSLCRMNDTTDIVLRMRGSRSWARGRRSPMRQAVNGSEPLVLRLRTALPNPGRAAVFGQGPDSFGNVCETLPERANPK